MAGVPVGHVPDDHLALVRSARPVGGHGGEDLGLDALGVGDDLVLLVPEDVLGDERPRVHHAGQHEVGTRVHVGHCLQRVGEMTVTGQCESISSRETVIYIPD